MYQKAKILDYKSQTVILKAGNHILECFTPDHYSMKSIKRDFKKGLETEVGLFLLNLRSSKRTSVRIKQVEKNVRGGCNSYKVRGKVIKIKDHPHSKNSSLVSLVCGPKITLEVSKENKPKVGEYIETEGRLDVTIRRSKTW